VLLAHVKLTLQGPDCICDSKTRPGDWVFVSHACVNQHGDPIRVAVRFDGTEYFVTTAYYSASQTHGRVVWRP